MHAQNRGRPAVTFSTDVAPIIFQHCTPCHRPGAVAPFSLLSYRDLRERLTQVGIVTANRIMPPWKPVGPRGEFLDDPSLSDAEIQTIQEWIRQGGREGDRAQLPVSPSPPEAWHFGTPDLVVTMAEAYVVDADGPDVFRSFVLPVALPSSRYVRVLEFRSDNPRAIHHANIGVDSSASSRRMDEREAGPGFSGGMIPDAASPSGHILGWAPGQRPRPSPDGMAWRLNPGSDLVVQLHMVPTGKQERVTVSLGLYFTDQPPSRSPVGLRLGSGAFEIPAGDDRYIVSDSYVLPVDVEVLAVQPHAHNLARSIEAVATRPDGVTRSLIAISDWDFRWQDVYRYRTPFVLPKGSTVSVRFRYDNSASNPRNPHRPPQRVGWGLNTSDEMADLWLQVVPRSADDFRMLSTDLAQRTLRRDLTAYRGLLAQDPTNSLHLDKVAMLSAQAGLVDDAIRLWQESLRLNSRSAVTHYNLGVALSSRQELERATNEFSEAVRLDPDYADAHNNLGAMFHLAGDLDQAVSHYAKAVELRPANAEAYVNLGRLYSIMGRREESARAFGNALSLESDLVVALAGLAWIRATAPEANLRDPQEALRLALRAARLSPDGDAAVLDSLAAAYASMGRFEDAVETARVAAQVSATREPALTEGIAKRIAQYLKRLPYRDER